MYASFSVPAAADVAVKADVPIRINMMRLVRSNADPGVIRLKHMRTNDVATTFGTSEGFLLSKAFTFGLFRREVDVLAGGTLVLEVGECIAVGAAVGDEATLYINYENA